MTTFQKYLLFSLTIALFSAIILLIFFVPRFDHTDTPQYISTIKYISGDPTGELFLRRVLNPMPLLIGSAIAPVFGVENTLIVQNLFFYFLSVWLIFLLIYRLYHNEKQAFYGAVLYVGAYPIIAYGLASLTDMSGYFFILLSVLLALNFLKKPQLKTALLMGVIAGFGMLFKESVAAVPILFVSIIFIATQLSFKEKLKYVLVFGAAFIVLPFINNMVLNELYNGYGYIKAYRAGGLYAEGSSGFYIVSTSRIIVEIGRVMLLGWLFVLFGVLREFALKNKERIKVLLALILPSLSVFLWCYPHNRMIFIAAPLLIPLASLGLLRKFKNPKINTFIEIALLIIYVLVNYLILEFLLKYGPMIQPYLNYE